MSSVPYIFATQSGNILLSELDANFANVKANVDYANAATTAITVTSSAQPTITSVGTLSSLAVSGNVSIGNISGTGAAFTGNVSSGNISGTGAAFTGNVSSDNISGTGAAFTGNISTANLTASTTLNNQGLEFIRPNYISVSSNTTATLSNTRTYNLIAASTTGLTLTINMPVSPVNGQVTRFAINGNAITLTAGTGNISYDFSGLNQTGNTYGYVYGELFGFWTRCD